jgi:lipooligosaccharide transport system permease protein
MGLGVGRYVEGIQGMSYLEFIGPGFIASTAMFGATFEITFSSYVRMTWQKTFDSIISTPVSAEDVVLGEILWAATKGVLFGLIMMLVLAVFGLIKSWLALWIIPFLFLGNMVFAILGMIVTSIVPSMDLFNLYFTLFITPSFLMSGIFFPIQDLPLPAQWLANLVPLHHLVDVVRPLAWGRPGPAVLWHIIFVVFMILILLPIPVYRMSKRLVN